MYIHIHTYIYIWHLEEDECGCIHRVALVYKPGRNSQKSAISSIHTVRCKGKLTFENFPIPYSIYVSYCILQSYFTYYIDREFLPAMELHVVFRLHRYIFIQHAVLAGISVTRRIPCMCVCVCACACVRARACECIALYI
jgi:hypothetical protein